MSAKKKKTILRTIRLSEDIDDLLEKDAVEQNVSANALITKIMTRYMEWNRIIDKTSYVVIPSLLFRALINGLGDQELEEIGKNAVANAVKELAMIAFGKADFDTLLNALSLITKYDTGLIASSPLSTESRIDSQYTITLRHDWGPKGSILLKSFFESLSMNEFGKQPTISITDDVVTVKFPRVQKPHP